MAEIELLLKPLIKKRGIIKAKFTLFEKYLKTLEGLNENAVERSVVIELEQRVEGAQQILSDFNELQTEIECIADDLDSHIISREEFENKFHPSFAKAKSFLEKFNTTNSDAQSVASSANHSSGHHASPDILGVKLPEIKLPRFDGSYNTWLEFRDIFESMIHTNVQLNNIQKFHYLRASLTGSATQAIQSLDFSSDNYIIAWNSLCERFNNKQLLVQNHLRAIFDMETIGSESSVKIRCLCDNVFKHLNNLKQLGEPTDSWDTILIYIMSGKLDKNSTHEWEKYKSNRDNVTLHEFREFLKRRATMLETVELGHKHTNEKQNVTRRPEQNQNTRFQNRKPNQYSRGLVSNTEVDTSNDVRNSKPRYKCYYCKKDHSLFHCSDFLKLSVKDRILKIKALQLCINCLRPNHTSKDCTWSGCKTCGKWHNTVLHDNALNSGNLAAAPALAVHQERENDLDICVHSISNTSTINTNDISKCTVAMSHQAILSTARVQASGTTNANRTITARALLDCGSQSSFVTSELCEKLHLPKTKVNLAVSGISDKLSYANYKCDIIVRSTNSSYSFKLSCFVLDKITSDLPDRPIDIHEFQIPIDIPLADPDFDVPQSIDILIGADAFWHLLCTGRINIGSHAPILQNTRLGWIVAGSAFAPTDVSKSRCNISTISVQEQLAKFWEVEEIDLVKSWSTEQQMCEQHFVENLKINKDGRYIVSLPFKDNPLKLGNSRDLAIRRFTALERRLNSSEVLRNLYTKFLTEYERLGHMTEVLDLPDNDKPEYFMPHHGVLKESSTSTKLRVVFNASAPTSTGISLNELQMVGPTIQQDLFSILLRFRMHKIVLSSDIQMMYRQVLINPEQRSLQKIVWRANPSDPIKIFQLNTVTYGTAAASFLAIRCLHEVARECESEHPVIANIIRNDMYVDDLLTSVDTSEEAKYVCEHISNVFRSRGFVLRKWKSNDESVIYGLDSEQGSKSIEFSNKEPVCKTLGLSWECERDILTYKIRPVNFNDRSKITKRVILSRIATIFDPLGLVSPCIIIAKVLLQKLWTEGLTWDQPLPEHILQSWLDFSVELDQLNKIVISRKVTCENPTTVSLHGFADASEASYGACLYIVTTNASQNHTSNLLCAKSKVAPLKSLTMPRLELCAALILSQLISKVLECSSLKFEKVYCWSDSTIVLGWLRTPPHTLKPFVANRVSEVQQLTNSFEWRHVPTLDNPADIVSRGLMPKHLISSRLWFHGPSWISNPDCWPTVHTPETDLPEKRKLCLVIHTPEILFHFYRFSSLSKLKHVAAYVFRFINNCRQKPHLRNLSHLTVDELNVGFLNLVKYSQQETFHEDIENLQKRGHLSSSSKILSLHPFVDDQGVLRVGGRLSNSDFPYDKKHPILLSPKHQFTKLIFEHEHRQLLHAGPQLLLSRIRDTFWPISGRSFAQKIVRDCVKCARFNVVNIQPIMGDLPKTRVQPTTPFSVVGVDYAGPFLMKNQRGRGSKTIKCWVALFICFSTRAIHLELVLSLSCEDFLQAFNRFVSRRGKPFEVFSDNGTNFIRANKELKEFGNFLQDNQVKIFSATSEIGIKWHFIPANSPHFGGIWEAGVRSLKHHLKRVLGNYSIFFFDFQTLLIRIESILNSRPLFPLSSSPDDLTSLTPAHFLIGKSSMTVPEPAIPDVAENRLSNYQLLQKMYEHFWNRWSHEYISELQERQRWKQNQGNLEIGQLVLVKDNNLPPTKWRMGRVVDLLPGKDGVKRVASVKTADGLISRAVVRLCPLPVVPIVS